MKLILKYKRRKSSKKILKLKKTRGPLFDQKRQKKSGTNYHIFFKNTLKRRGLFRDFFSTKISVKHTH